MSVPQSALSTANDDLANGPLSNSSVRRVIDALAAGGSNTRVVALTDTARSAQDAAQALGTELGAIVKSLVFVIGDQPVMALVAGDRQADTAALPGCLGLEGRCKRADAEVVRAATGFAIGGVAPLGHPAALPIALDASLGRFPTVFAAAGHPHCVFPTTLDELARLTGGVVDARIAKNP
ncbi:YbaK/EbsC family protein [Rhodospirillum rubrum]|uniref:YbaK/prolyl-tRNA synthetase associated region n=1 Tax=Rhodospirillum rubrum (strain ATCC 11170 / ATH 1.1.1 / DSM 467 / LMG 4362 / NCIMB 8255 / S1) TaxID=269796 RepID=Q2RXK5_RHORT|nr:YbaK/EbsC family protein [Rhodospirillum rubrum]ABC21140.1 YbaK/prolyl-tRNA synthetase associated region [Rhodospirillum rubrum ATCC 11170]AEO46809.1 YbaK/prolyl-tRNA synthetase associated region [Rhodospirillum rubrum F11]MBK5952688.1 aminoacyl-tRNA deacylase [Rhodospirillum rubrum]QXG80832.1 YbaK/EbsC family protein [Rhodospirillum rubrum]HAP98558.1 YbaK/EbsC family protein [Rhodospirillum rubrum]